MLIRYIKISVELPASQLAFVHSGPVANTAGPEHCGVEKPGHLTSLINWNSLVQIQPPQPHFTPAKVVESLERRTDHRPWFNSKSLRRRVNTGCRLVFLRWAEGNKVRRSNLSKSAQASPWKRVGGARTSRRLTNPFAHSARRLTAVQPLTVKARSIAESRENFSWDTLLERPESGRRKAVTGRTNRPICPTERSSLAVSRTSGVVGQWRPGSFDSTPLAPSFSRENQHFSPCSWANHPQTPPALETAHFTGSPRDQSGVAGYDLRSGPNPEWRHFRSDRICAPRAPLPAPGPCGCRLSLSQRAQRRKCGAIGENFQPVTVIQVRFSA